jgi:hypothetical protein
MTPEEIEAFWAALDKAQEAGIASFTFCLKHDTRPWSDEEAEAWWNGEDFCEFYVRIDKEGVVDR